MSRTEKLDQQLHNAIQKFTSEISDTQHLTDTVTQQIKEVTANMDNLYVSVIVWIARTKTCIIYKIWK